MGLEIILREDLFDYNCMIEPYIKQEFIKEKLKEIIPTDQNSTKDSKLILSDDCDKNLSKAKITGFGNDAISMSHKKLNKESVDNNTPIITIGDYTQEK